MRIMHIIATVNPIYGGPIEGISQLGNAFNKLGIHVDVVSCDDPDQDWVRNSPLNVIALGPSYLNYSYTPKLDSWLLLNAGSYDVIIINGLWQYNGFGSWRALKKLGKPYFVFTHGMLDPWFKKRYPLKHLKKWLYWPWAEYRVLRDAAAVIFTCEEERLLARQSFPLYSAIEKVTSYGTSGPACNINDAKRKFLDKFPECQGKRVVLFLSRIHPKKGCDLLIEAFSRIKKEGDNLHLVMAGPDSWGWGPELKSRAKALGIETAMTWAGMLSGDIKWGAFAAAEIFCLPSHQENFGIVVAEALACGTPVLISRQVNIWREIAEDNAGFVDDDTVEGTLRNLQKWVSLDASTAREYRNNARNCFMDRFHIDKAAARLLEIAGFK